MSFEELIIEGARQNNLKNISLVLPHDKVIAVTGVSGSGKSSLAFDTIFAEGQWRFIESLSTYARLFIEKMDRPAVDSIRNIRPAIALEQRNPVRGSRSTVGTATEIYDYFRLLYSKIGVPFCPSCGQRIRKWDPTTVKQEILKEHRGQRALIVFESREPAEVLKAKGFYRYFKGGQVLDFPDMISPAGISSNGKGVSVVLDRLVIRDDARLADSIETAFKHGGGRMKVLLAADEDETWKELRFSTGNVCDNCGAELAEPSPLLFSFNHPIGACPECKGFGNILKYSEDLIVPDPYLSVSEGAIEPWEKPSYKWWKRQMLKTFKNKKSTGPSFPVSKPWKELSKSEKELLFKGGPDFYGIDDFFEDLEGRRYKLHVRVFLSRYRKGQICPSCAGKRLRPEALAFRIDGKDIAELTAMSIGGLEKLFSSRAFLLSLSPEDAAIAKEPLRQINLKLSFLKRVGLDYLSLNREARTLSGGEYQRVNLSNQLASRLTGTLYVLDEPTVGLHPRDTERVSDIMSELSALGNTLVVVEHDKEIIERADWVVELGPGGGHLGGSVVFSGTQKEFLDSDTLTARYITGADRIKAPAAKWKPNSFSPWLGLYGASGNNLKGIDLKIPVGAFTVVSGVSGSGKSSLVVETLYRALARQLKVEPETPLPHKSLKGTEAIHGVKLMDQSPIGRTPRSNPVTYLKIFDHIRKLYASQPEAKAHGYGPGFFSFNIPGGRCPTCGGEGYQKFEMYFFEDLFIKCEDCGARRYTPEALRVHYRDKDISQVLEMTVEEGRGFFSGIPAIAEKLSQLEEIGLGYLKLGQPATTLSGGEAQRLKICAELGLPRKSDFLYVLDEPTVGLHYYDVGALLKMLRKLVERGGTVLVIEHNLDVIEAADWVIDLGPEGGENGGHIVFQGTPEGLRKASRSHTGRYLKKHQGSR
ncbi:MAG: excinuclease ABC subunit UvrA [Nitrospiraceae bacterium]|nr:excinuclease ABC subunit UvrA [Nitrospiraceae bacterium]